MTDVVVSLAHNDFRLLATRQFLDTGTGNAAIRIYGGTRPASPADAPTSVMLCQAVLTKPCGEVTGNQLVLTQDTDDAFIVETGVATWARFVNGDGSTAFDCDAGEGPGPWTVQLPQAQLFAGGAVRVTAAALS